MIDRYPSRFDDFTRALARGASRRAVLKALAVSAGAAMLTWLGPGRAEAGEEDPEGGCRPDGTPCRFRRQCCSRNCVDAACRCRNEGIRCRSSAQCCSELCEKGICNCRGFKETCKSDAECCQDKVFDNANGRKVRPRGNGPEPARVSCQNGICTCSFNGESCSTVEDCCFADICFKGTCFECQTQGESCSTPKQCCPGLTCEGFANGQSRRPGANGNVGTCQPPI